LVIITVIYFAVEMYCTLYCTFA